jgi:hypothetical protein
MSGRIRGNKCLARQNIAKFRELDTGGKDDVFAVEKLMFSVLRNALFAVNKPIERIEKLRWKSLKLMEENASVREDVRSQSQIG